MNNQDDVVTIEPEFDSNDLEKIKLFEDEIQKSLSTPVVVSGQTEAQQLDELEKLIKEEEVLISQETLKMEK